MQEYLALKNFRQCRRTLEFLRQV